MPQSLPSTINFAAARVIEKIYPAIVVTLISKFIIGHCVSVVRSFVHILYQLPSGGPQGYLLVGESFWVSGKTIAVNLRD
jgi:hypothetical protein